MPKLGSLGDFLSISENMGNNTYNLTDNGKCVQCGECCSNFLPMSKKEINEIHRYIKKHNIKEFKNLFPVNNPTFDFTCPFLNADKSKEKCMIYEVRPMICRKFICDNKQRKELTQQETDGLDIVDMRHEFYGAESFIERFTR